MSECAAALLAIDGSGDAVALAAPPFLSDFISPVIPRTKSGFETEPVPFGSSWLKTALVARSEQLVFWLTSLARWVRRTP